MGIPTFDLKISKATRFENMQPRIPRRKAASFCETGFHLCREVIITHLYFPFHAATLFVSLP